MPSATNSDKIASLEKAVTLFESVTRQLQSEIAEVKATLKEREAAFTELAKAHALLQQRHDDHVKRAEVWGQRWWTLAAGMILALFAATVALVRK